MMNAKNDKKTKELLFEETKFLKSLHNRFQRLHLEKIVRGEKKKTTVSMETVSYELLALKLGAVPHTREANELIKDLITEKMERGEGYDDDNPKSFSRWLKRIILLELVSNKLSKEWNEFLGVKYRR